MSEEDVNSSEKADEAVVMYTLRLFITGATPNSVRAIANIKDICDRYLNGRYALEIIDVYQHKEVAQKEQIIALPLLIKTHPLPEKRLIGDLSDATKVLQGLGLTMEQ
jgi:circadian clock protein KaiB